MRLFAEDPRAKDVDFVSVDGVRILSLCYEADEIAGVARCYVTDDAGTIYAMRPTDEHPKLPVQELRGVVRIHFRDDS